MKNKLAILFILHCLLNSISAISANHFYTVGSKLYDPCAVEFNIRGLNYAPYGWGYAPNELLINEIAQTGANTVRLAWYANNSDAQTHTVYTAAKLAAALDACTTEGVLPILELHDQTCQNSSQALISLSDYYLQAEVKTVLLARQNKLIINIANESLFVLWANNALTAQNSFVSTYNTIVAKLRNAGYTCPLMIDAPDCGTNSDLLAAVGQTLINADLQHNLIFSAHTYWFSFANNTPATMLQKIQLLVNAGIPFVLGEVANEQDDARPCQYTLAYQQMLVGCQSMGINWLAWSWNKDVCPNRQMSSTGRFANLTTYGIDIVNNSTYGLKTKAIKSAYLSKNGCATSSLFQVSSTDSDLNINVLNEYDGWKISSSHPTVLQVKLYGLNGQFIDSRTLHPYDSKSIAYPIEKGEYLLKISDCENRSKVIKQITIH